MSGLGESLLGAEPQPDSTRRDDVVQKKAEEIIASSSIGGSKGLGLCLLAMGISSFPVCETLLLQTSMFSDCFKWGPSFYGKATLCLCTHCAACVPSVLSVTHLFALNACRLPARSPARLGYPSGAEPAGPKIR